MLLSIAFITRKKTIFYLIFLRIKVSFFIKLYCVTNKTGIYRFTNLKKSNDFINEKDFKYKFTNKQNLNECK